MQLAAVLASLVGRWVHLSTARLRLLVACGAAGGIASAYNAPIGGALFVAEIVLGTLAMESFGPLVFSSVIATLTVQQLLGTDPLYDISIPTIHLNSNWEIIPHLLLGIVRRAGCTVVPARAAGERTRCSRGRRCRNGRGWRWAA